LVANSEEANYSNNFMQQLLLPIVGTVPQQIAGDVAELQRDAFSPKHTLQPKATLNSLYSKQHPSYTFFQWEAHAILLRFGDKTDSKNGFKFALVVIMFVGVRFMDPTAVSVKNENRHIIHDSTFKAKCCFLVFVFYNPILFAICTSTISKLCKNVSCCM
jgi:hypothetical protein